MLRIFNTILFSGEIISARKEAIAVPKTKINSTSLFEAYKDDSKSEQKVEADTFYRKTLIASELFSSKTGLLFLKPR